jgi:hypothetical protein
MVYDYSQIEKIVMAIITGVSNFACLPCLMLMIIQERPFEFYIGLFTMLTSFMYHVTESLDVNFYLEPGKWHALDNIGSICCFTSLLVYFMNFSKQRGLKLNYLSIFLVLTIQAENPWDLFNTIMPIVLFVVILIIDYVLNGYPKCNFETLTWGVGVLLIAVSMFLKGLDEHSDYMRIAHSLWHITVGISTFYLRQAKEKRFLSFSQIFSSINYSKIETCI